MAKLALIFSATFYLTSHLYGGDHVMYSEKLPTAMFDCSDISSIDLFIDNDDNSFVLVHSIKDFLYMNNNWAALDTYGRLLNGFIKDGNFHLAFQKDEKVVIYNIQKDIKFAGCIVIKDVPRGMSPHPDRIIAASEQNSSYCFLGSSGKFPLHPIEFLKTIMSAGHGIIYEKPYLADIQDDKILKYRKIRYGGKIDESFIIKEVIKGEDSIHFLGFRGAKEPGTSPLAFAWNKPVILHYAEYDLKRKKIVRKHSIYENTPRSDKHTDTYFSYGPLSIDNLDDGVFVVFTWIEISHFGDASRSHIEDTKSVVYYSQAIDNRFGDIEEIGSGFLPLVRVDSLRNVHVLWLNGDGCLVHKVKKDGRWSEEKIIFNNVDIYPGIIFTRYFSAEFDTENNLHVAYPSGGDLVHAKVKVN